MSVVFTRLVLGYVLALPFVALLVAGSISGEQRHMFVLRMSGSSTGLLQVFYDVGSGYTGQHSAGQLLRVSDKAVEYRFPLPPATYRSIRIDPGSGVGIYTIERATIVGRGSTMIDIPLTEFQAVQQLTVLERTTDRLMLSAAGDSNDPILVWTPSSPIRLMFEPRQTLHTIGYAALLWLGGTVVAWGAVWLLLFLWPAHVRTLARAWASASGFGASNPAIAIVVSALLATLVATYPVVFAGRSFASPTNGGTLMLYDQLPFLPGADDFDIEDTRGTDVGAMMWQSVPHARAEREALAMGEVPLWNRHTALGRPLWGQGLTYILDPLQWLTFLGSDPAPGWDLKFLAHRFVFASGVGLAALAATGAWIPAAIAAAAAPFAGAFVYRFNHPAIFSLAYAPWTLLGWFLVAKATSARASARAVIVLTVSTSLLLVAPTPKEAAIAVLGMSATGAIAVLLSADSWRLRGQRLAAAMMAGIAVALLTAPHWLVFLDTLRQSAHAYETPNLATGGLLHGVALWVSPLMPGTPQPGLHLFALVLVAAAMTAPLRLWEDRSALASAIGAALLIAVALGIVPTSVLNRMPLISQIGHLYDVLLMAALTPLLIVCATGARILWSAGVSRTLVATTATGAAGWWMLKRLGESGPFDRFEPWAVALLLPLAVAFPECLRVARPDSAGAVAAAGAAMMTLMLPGGLHLDSGATAIDRLLLQPRPRPSLTQSSPAIDAIHAATTEPMRTTGVSYTLFAGTQMLYGLEDIRGADPLEVLAYRELIDASGIQRHGYWLTTFETNDIPRLTPILDMLNVGFLVMARADTIPAGSRLLPMKGPDLVRAIQRPTPWPRAFFTDSTSTYTTPAGLFEHVAVHRTAFAAVLEGDTRASEATSGLPRRAGRAVPADHYVLTSNTTSFRVRADTEGIAVLGETYLPDEFIATLNGTEVPYFRVNHVFKAVRIPGPGEWEIRFEYRPRRWALALRLAAIGAAIACAIAGIAFWPPGIGGVRG